MSETAFQHVYFADILFEDAPCIDVDKLCTAMQRYCGNVKMERHPDGGFQFFHLDHPIQFDDGSALPQAVISAARGPVVQDQLSAALGQSWDWPEAEEIVPRHRFSLIFCDLFASRLDYKLRLRLFKNSLRALLDVTSPLAIHWRSSQQVVSPEAFRRSFSPEQFDEVYPAVNVRLFNITDSSNKAMLMDSLGLAALGIPDVQCHFAGIEANAMARQLYDCAYYLFEHGDIIQDGEVVDGIAPGQHWRCQHEIAMLAPERVVLDLNPGAPYAQGNR